MKDIFNDIGMADITPKKNKTEIQKARELQAKIAQGVNEGKISRAASVPMHAALREGRLNSDLSIME